MLGRFSRSVGPIVVVDREDIENVFLMAEDARKLSATDPEYANIDRPISARVILQNGDRFDCKTVDDVLSVRDIRSNPIREIVIDGGVYSVCRIEVSLGGRWYHSQGATIDISSEENFAREFESRFDRIFRKERPINEWIASAHPFLIALAIWATFGYLTNFLLNGGKLVYRDTSLLVGFGSILGATLAISWIVVDQARARFFGRAVFNWSDGKTRFERNLKITNYMMWTLPVTIAIKLYIGS